MTKIDSTAFINYLNEKWKNVSCPLCKKGPWGISDSTFELREFHGGNMVIGGQSSILPVVPVTCNNCGNTVLISALKAGVIEQETAEEKPVEGNDGDLPSDGGNDE